MADFRLMRHLGTAVSCFDVMAVPRKGVLALPLLRKHAIAKLTVKEIDKAMLPKVARK